LPGSPEACDSRELIHNFLRLIGAPHLLLILHLLPAAIAVLILLDRVGGRLEDQEEAHG
jgi:hypothetical protein